MMGYRYFQNLVMGHYEESFPHLCPGSDCAIAKWLLRKKVQRTYSALTSKRG